MCGSHDVRWRRRWWYDAVRNELRFWCGRVLGGTFGNPGVATHSETGFGATSLNDRRMQVGHNDDVAALHAEQQFVLEREFYDARIATTTPTLFWKCRGCRRKGHVFESPTNLLKGSERLAELEGRSLLGADPLTRSGANRSGLDRKD
jgi:hypothetical protein